MRGIAEPGLLVTSRRGRLASEILDLTVPNAAALGGL